MSNFLNENTDQEAAEILRYTPETSPKEALTNIDRADYAAMHPDEYTEMKDTLEPEFKVQERTPAEVSEELKSYMSQSSEHSALVQNEIKPIDNVVKQIKVSNFKSERKRELANEIQELTNKKYKEGKLEDHEEEMLQYLYDEMGEQIPDDENEADPFTFSNIFKKITGAGKEYHSRDWTKNKQAQYAAWHMWGKRSIQNNVQKLLSEQYESGTLPPDKRQRLDDLQSEMQKQEASFGVEGYGTVFGQALGLPLDMVEAVSENLLTVGVGVGTGATVGSLLPGLGTITGALTGLGAGITGAISQDMYERVTTQVYEDLTQMKGVNLAPEVKKNISRGVGVVSAALESVTGGALTFGFGRLAGKRVLTSAIKDAGARAATEVIGHAIRTGGISATEEVLQEIADITSKHYATFLSQETKEGEKPSTVSMSAFWKAVKAAGNDIATNPEVRKRLGITGVTGALGGGGIALGTGVAATPKIKLSLDTAEQQRQQREAGLKQYQERANIINQAYDVLDHHASILAASEMSKETELKNLSPEQLSEIRKQAFNDRTFYFNDSDIDKIAESNPEIAAKIREFDMTEMTQAESGGIAGIPAHQFLDLVDDAPTIADYGRLNPEAPNPFESREVLKRLDDAKNKRAEIFKARGTEVNFTPEQEQQLKEAEDSIDKTFKDYLIDTDLDKAIEKIMPETQAEQYTKAQFETREAVNEQVNKEFEIKELRDQEAVLKAYESIEKEQIAEEYRQGTEAIEKLKPIMEADIAVPIAKHAQKGFSQYAVDPVYLPDNLREAYVTDSKLKKAKMFVEGGITPDESAALLGFESGEQMFKIIANTPNRKEMVAIRKAEMAKNKKLLKDIKAEDAEERRNKVFDDAAKLHKMEIDFIRKQKWGTAKQGVRLAAYPKTSLPEIQMTAIKSIQNTKVKDIKPRQFNAAKKVQGKKAVQHILKNEALLAIQAKEKEMLQSELTRESLNAQAAIDKARLAIKNITSKKGMKVLKNANMDKRVNELLDLFNMKDSKGAGKSVNQEAYFDYLRRLEDEGKTVVVPEHLTDIRQRGADLTVLQFLNIADTMQNEYHKAKRINKLFKSIESREKAGKAQTIEALLMGDEGLVTDLETHPAYTKPKKSKGEPTKLSIAAEGVKELYERIERKVGASVTNYKNVVTELDRDMLGGKHYEILGLPMVESERFKRVRTAETITQIKKIIKDYGEKDFDNAANDFIKIPEFEGFYGLGNNRDAKTGEGLNNGVLSRRELWTLFAYLGDPQGRERIANFKNPETGVTMDYDVVKTALERVLSDKDAKLAQNFTNIFKSFEAEAKALHERTTGVVPNMIKAVPIEFNGKVYDGGYAPLNYLKVSSDQKIDKFLDKVKKETAHLFGVDKDSEMYARLRSAEQTEQGRLKDRTGSTRPLNLNFMNFLHAYEEHIHDLAYRESSSDVLKLLKNEVYKNAIINTVGEKKYNVLIDGIIETVGKSTTEDFGPFSETYQDANAVYKWLEQGFNVAVLGFNPTSILKQPLSIGAAKLRMGDNGSKYLAKSAAQVMASLDGTTSYKALFDEAVAINPDVALNRDSVDDSMIKSTYDFIVNTSKTSALTSVKILKAWHGNLVDAAMYGIKNADIHIKVMVTRAAYAQFMDGQVQNFSQNKLDKMSRPEQIKRAKQYAKQVADLALTTSATIDKNAIEKTPIMRIFTRFYTDIRAQHNTALAEVRKIKYGIKEASKATDVQTAINQRNQALKSAASLITVYALMRAYEGLFTKEETPIDELAKVNSIEDLGKFAVNTTAFALNSPVQGMIGSTPILRSIQYALGSNRKAKQLNLPLTKQLSDFTTAIGALGDYFGGQNLSKAQVRSLRYSGAYLTQFPWNGTSKVINILENVDNEIGASEFVKSELGRLAKNTADFIETYKDDPKRKDEVEVAKKIQREMIPAQDKYVKEEIPENTMEILKMNKWDDLDYKTGAAGIYQFTEAQWDKLAEENPDLGLTEDGRISEDTTEQEKAMRQELEQNAQALIAFNFPVTIENLYGAHRFGVEDYAMILSSKDNEKLSDIVENTQLFEGLTIVKHVKKYVKKRIKN